ncbi:MAG: FAD-dependent oxidoreductase [Gammaproteobacteria bacterium]
MHGMVFGELKKFVDKKLGGDTWRTALSKAGFGNRVYVPIKVYPDTEILTLVATLSGLTGLDTNTILKAFGTFISADLLHLFRRQIQKHWTVMDLFEQIEDTIHNVVRLKNPGAKPPQLQVERLTPEDIVIHYSSSRRMCALGVGLIEGIADQFGDPLSVNESSCMHRGDACCTIHIKLLIPASQAVQFSAIELDSHETEASAIPVKPATEMLNQRPVIIVGAGPVGIHAARQLLHLAPLRPVTIFGAEPWEPYNRVRLSELLSGDVEWDEISNELKVPPEKTDALLKINTPIVGIDRQRQIVVDAAGNRYAYAKLILAVGSRPCRADAKTMTSLHGIYVYRDLDDAQTLMTNIVQSENTVVTGGGVLGIEVAFALKTQNPETEITILHHHNRLMNKQLDEEASEFLLGQVQAAGINVLLNTTIDEFIGDNELKTIRLSNGELLPCDTLVSCLGIIPNISLARDANLETNRGIKVNDYLQTNDPNIYAVGECAEHRSKTYGLLRPGMEQATIAVENIVKGNHRKYQGTNYSMRAKVKHLPIFALEKAGLHRDMMQKMVFKNDNAVLFREFFLRKGRLVGATVIGDWPEFAQTQEAIDKGKRVWPWHRFYFSRNGSLGPYESMRNPLQWPMDTVVCTCGAVTRGELEASISEGCKSVADLSARTGAAQGCGTCKPVLGLLLGGDGANADTGSDFKGPMTVFMLLALIVVGGYFLPAFHYPTSIGEDGFIFPLVFTDFWRQVTGYSAVGLVLVSLMLSLNKHWHCLQFAGYGFWRATHVAVLALALAALLIHTNLGFGFNFNYRLQLAFLTTVATGTLLGLLVIFEGGFWGAVLRRYRMIGLRIHIVLVWCFFGLALVHIASVYYF